MNGGWQAKIAQLLQEAGTAQPGEIPSEEEICDERDADAFAAKVRRNERLVTTIRMATGTFVTVNSNLMCVN